MNLWHRIRALLCPLLGHRWIGDPYRKVCVYCWRQIHVPYQPPDPDPDRMLDGTGVRVDADKSQPSRDADPKR